MFCYVFDLIKALKNPDNNSQIKSKKFEIL